MLQYDPHQHVNSEAWQALDESERIESVRQYHRQNRIRLANESLHATTHVIVENQVALGDTFAARAVLLRLMAEGLDRMKPSMRLVLCYPNSFLPRSERRAGPIPRRRLPRPEDRRDFDPIPRRQSPLA